MFNIGLRVLSFARGFYNPSKIQQRAMEAQEASALVEAGASIKERVKESGLSKNELTKLTDTNTDISEFITACGDSIF